MLGRGLILALAVPWADTPPEYATFGRQQAVERSIDSEDLLRIWVVYIDQGDGILIQLPTRCNYDPDPTDNDPTRSERVDILIDGGSAPTTEAWRMADFITELYGESPTIEYAIITHHDQDHVAGLTELLEDTRIGIETIFHNGLASYRAGKRDFPLSPKPDNAVVDFGSGVVKRGMAFLEDDGERMKTKYLVDTLGQLRSRFRDGEFQGVYEDLARAIVGETVPFAVQAFERVHEGSDFIAEREADRSRGVNLAGITFEVLWPLSPCREYGNWGETINGTRSIAKPTNPPTGPPIWHRSPGTKALETAIPFPRFAQTRHWFHTRSQAKSL